MDIQQLHNQAQSAQRNGNLAEAARLYHEILTTAPVPEVMVNYGNVLARLGNRLEALAQYDQALKQNPPLFEALFNRAPEEPPVPAPANDSDNEECLSQPGKPADGQHWVYRLDGHRRCWFLVPEGTATLRQRVHHRTQIQSHSYTFRTMRRHLFAADISTPESHIPGNTKGYCFPCAE